MTTRVRVQDEVMELGMKEMVAVRAVQPDIQDQVQVVDPR